MPTALQHRTSDMAKIEQYVDKDRQGDEVGTLEATVGGGDLENTDQEAASSLEAKKQKNCFLRIVTGFFKRKPLEVKSKDAVLELLQPTRYKPSDVDTMAEETKFTKAEVKFMYRAFKTECPNGIIDEETFKEVYEKIFPLGDASKYAHLVFRAIDRDRTGGITFGDFMEFLSVISKGTEEEKMMWSFQFYDVNQDGTISRDEMLKVTESIYDLMGASYNEKGTMQHVEKVFASMDRNRDGLVTVEEFISYCTRTDRVFKSLLVLP